MATCGSIPARTPRAPSCRSTTATISNDFAESPGNVRGRDTQRSATDKFLAPLTPGVHSPSAEASP